MSERQRRWAPSWAAGAAVLCGVGLAAQSRVNGQLGAELGDGYVAALISTVVGLTILIIGMLLVKKGRVGVGRVHEAIAAKRIPWWYTVGGAAGGVFLLSQGLASAALGVALFSIAVVCGQTLSGVLIDRLGLGTHEPRPINAQRVIGSLLAVAAVVIAGSSQLATGTEPWLLILPFVAGFGIAWQQAVNGQIRIVALSALTASFGNFVVAAFVLVVAWAVHAMVAGFPQEFPTNPVLYFGGVIGVTFLALGTVVVGITGVLLLTLGIISGQLLMSLVLDIVVPVASHPVQWTTLAGIALALAAVVIVATAKSRTESR